jgi:molybdopterin molybdotransferase
MKTLAQIVARLEGYDPQALRADIALQFLLRLVQPVTQFQSVDLMQALHGVVAHDLVSPIHVPAHDNSAMDGYAFAGAQLLAHQALALRVVGTALAGKAWAGSVNAGECVKIMTGAVMPQGLDTVVPQELVQRQGDTIHLPPGAVRLGDNRRFMGEDIRCGEPALKAGSRITPAALGLLASLGVPLVPVLRRLRVAFFSTGDEILNLGDAPREGAVYDSNRYTLFGLLTHLGVDAIDMGLVRDEPEALEAAFRSAAMQADAIITSGGVSVGEADHTKATMQKLGDVAFWKIAMRPGRPMAVGQLPRMKSASSPMDIRDDSYQLNSKSNTESPVILFGLPGNPVAVMVTFLAFVRPALLQMMGCAPSRTPMLKARALEPIRKKPGRTEYQRAVVSSAADAGLWVKITGQQGSGVLSSMVHANGLLVLPHDQGDVAAGDWVDVMMFEGAI